MWRLRGLAWIKVGVRKRLAWMEVGREEDGWHKVRVPCKKVLYLTWNEKKNGND
jgi:hypothetical protein